MRFVLGDIIKGKKCNGCSITNSHSLLLVTRVNRSEMTVVILQHNVGYIGQDFEVDNLSSKFERTTIEEFEREHPGYYKMEKARLDELLAQYPKVEETEEEKIANPYVLSDEMRRELLEEMRTLLVKYHYHPTDEGLNRILDEWCKNKADLIRLFEKHPNYNGKFQIVFDCDFDRSIDRDAIDNFKRWLKSDKVRSVFINEVKLGVYSYRELRSICSRLYDLYSTFERNDSIRTINGKTYEEYFKEYLHFRNLKSRYEDSRNIYCTSYHAYDRDSYNKYEKLDKISAILSYSSLNQLIDDTIKDYCRDYFPDAKIRKGQKTSRAINKLLCMLGFDKLPDYNKEFAKFADAINPLKIKRHTVISIHPIDYYTMSFGNSWSSCHTIDKRNDRRIDGDHSYRGCNSSGTESYMLDRTSCVFYTVKAEYEGNNLELEDKINRCMFHYYDNRLLQGRVYPQSNDRGGNNLYKDIREIAQKVFADMLDVPNYWTNKSGTDICYEVTDSYGTHFKDYTNYESCNVSTLKDDRTDHKFIIIGNDPICPSCGCIHSRTDNIECNECN